MAVSRHRTADGAKELAQEGGSGRRVVTTRMVEGLGGKLEALYYAFGDIHLFAIVDLPDIISAAAIALAANRAGGITAKTVVLITPEEMDKAGKLPVDYRAPGH
jgi:uncharacterized protein with GYD domain